tara:strand:+ start:49284 stop:49415 length:132 start_codon:yes stop_codon:yes gene_type:complete
MENMIINFKIFIKPQRISTCSNYSALLRNSLDEKLGIKMLLKI